MPGSLQSDSVGPVDVAVVRFDGNSFDADLVPALADLQASGAVRLVDLAFVRKEPDGRANIVQWSDGEVSGVYEQISDVHFELLRDEDLGRLTSDLPPASSALVLVWENSWAARLASAVSRSKGTVTAFERIPFDRVRQALAEVERRG